MKQDKEAYNFKRNIIISEIAFNIENGISLNRNDKRYDQKVMCDFKHL